MAVRDNAAAPDDFGRLLAFLQRQIPSVRLHGVDYASVKELVQGARASAIDFAILSQTGVVQLQLSNSANPVATAMVSMGPGVQFSRVGSAVLRLRKLPTSRP